MSVVEFNELYSALERNDTNVIDRYLNADIARCVNLRYGQQHLLNAAARSGNAALVQRVLDLGVNVAAVEDWFGYTALHDAAIAAMWPWSRRCLPLAPTRTHARTTASRRSMLH